METRRGEPTPPMPLGPPGSSGRHLPHPPVVVPADVIARLAGAAPVITDAGALDEAGRDWWPLALTWAVAGEIPARPAVIARPETTAQLSEVLRICNEAVVPVTPVAGRSGVCGASIPVFGGISLDLTAMHGIVDVDDTSLLLRVRAGTFGDVLEDDLRATHAVTLGHWPQSIALSTVGGWLACRGAGQYSTRYGKIEDMVVGMEVVLADGSVVHTGGRAPRQAVGPDLNQLFVGSEGTLGVITEATLTVHPVPSTERRQAWGFSTFTDGLEACRRILRRGATPAVLRLYDTRETGRTFKLDTNALIVLDEGDAGLVDATMAVVAAECGPRAEPLPADLVAHWLGHRNDVSQLPELVGRGIVLDTIEIAARWGALPAIYEEAVAALMRIDGMLAASAHQSHAYNDGACLYFTWAAQPTEGQDKDDLYRTAWDRVTDITLDHGGALSHHHGVGLNRSRFVEVALGDGLDVLRSVKEALDPNGILNPGKFDLPCRWGPSTWP